MKKIYYKLRFVWHYAKQRHNEVLIEDCLSEPLIAKLRLKASYHKSQATKYNTKLVF
ncbi:hypothetical protein [Bacillus sp. V59.32b]|uniref:hypothetical protein n=1 Tax=Bacillus sp. V59.32b TaxID=1758642 RepID=UPI0013570FF8|nr:hypothetical protein [Bacillus sp. V59.32b]